jgi:DNA (cytosine-5)-methyltransferase 1
MKRDPYTIPLSLGNELIIDNFAGGGGKSAVVTSHLVTVGYGERPGQSPRIHNLETPLGTVVASGVKHGLVAASLVDMGHGESTAAGAKRWSHGVRDIKTPLNTVTASGGTSALTAVHLAHLTHHGDRAGTTPGQPLPTVTAAHRGEQVVVSACLEQAYGGFYDGDGRAVDTPLSTVTATGSQQRLIAAYYVKYYSSGGQDGSVTDPMHTFTTKGRMGLVEVAQVPIDCLAPEHRERARQCTQLLHQHLPEHFPNPAELVLFWHHGTWWALVDITLRMLKPKELFKAQGFPLKYIIDEIPDPEKLFVNGKQVFDPLSVPRIKLSGTAQVRMCGNSVCPPLAKALAKANFKHEQEMAGVAA